MSRTFVDNPQYRYENLGTLDDVRAPRSNRTSESAEDAMNSMLNIILTHKKEIQKLPHFSSIESSNDWINRHPNSGLRADVKDLDGDGTQEVVLYNRAGKPVIVNGYKLRASDYPQRRAYWGTHPKPSDRIGEDYNEWVTNKVYDVQEDPNNMWRRRVRRTELGDAIKEWGYRMPTAPRKKDSPYSIFCKLIKDPLNAYLNGEFKGELGEAVGDDNVKFIKKIASPISMYRMMYLKLVERPYFFLLSEKGTVRNYEHFKEYQRTHKGAFMRWFYDNYLTGDRLSELRRDKVPFAVIKGTFIKGELNLEGTDPDDSIVFLLGLDNINDSTTKPFDKAGNANLHPITFEDLILNNASASVFNHVCTDKKDPCYKDCKKALEKFKKRAQASTKAYFKSEIQRLFENRDALALFQAARQAGQNELAQTPAIAQEAAQELQQQGIAPASPLRPPDTREDTPQEQQQNANEEDDNEQEA